MVFLEKEVAVNFGADQKSAGLAYRRKFQPCPVVSPTCYRPIHSLVDTTCVRRSLNAWKFQNLGRCARLICPLFQFIAQNGHKPTNDRTRNNSI